MEKARKEMEDAYASVAMLMFESAFAGAPHVSWFEFYSDCEGGAITACMIPRSDGSEEKSSAISYVFSALALASYDEGHDPDVWLAINDPTGIAKEFHGVDLDALYEVESKFSDALFFLRDFSWPHFSTALNSQASMSQGGALVGGTAVEIAKSLGLDSIAAAMEQAALEESADADSASEPRRRSRSAL